MLKKVRTYVGTLLVNFQLGVNVIGLPELHSHTRMLYKVEQEKNLNHINE
jgi:hypothetical protein